MKKKLYLYSFIYLWLPYIISFFFIYVHSSKFLNNYHLIPELSSTNLIIITFIFFGLFSGMILKLLWKNHNITKRHKKIITTIFIIYPIIIFSFFFLLNGLVLIQEKYEYQVYEKIPQSNDYIYIYNVKMNDQLGYLFSTDETIIYRRKPYSIFMKKEKYSSCKFIGIKPTEYSVLIYFSKLDHSNIENCRSIEIE